MMLLTMSLMLSMLFMMLNHPMSMGLILLLQTIMVTMITGMMNSNFWFSYILFLIMIGGMLILFIYMTSIASNEMFIYSNNILYFIFTMSFFMMMINNFNDNFFIYYMNNYNEMNFKFSLMKFFNYPSIFIMLLMILYLFITLIAIVKITKIEYGPLRQKQH